MSEETKPEATVDAAAATVKPQVEPYREPKVSPAIDTDDTDTDVDVDANANANATDADEVEAEAEAEAEADAESAAKKKEASEELTKRLQKLALERQKVSKCM